MAGAPRVFTYDTTLRDGEQREGVALTLEDKLRITERLVRLGIDYIEGGFPGSNPKDDGYFAHVKDLDLGDSRIVAFGTVRRKNSRASDDLGLKALAESGAHAVTVVGKASSIQVSEALQCSLMENIRMVSDSVRFLKQRVPEVFFDAEHFFDAYENDREYALAVVKAAVDSHADCIVLCDTNGGMLPHDIVRIMSDLYAWFPTALFGIHAHNDCGCGIANTLAAVQTGAIQVQGTINGYGERVGNADLTVVIPNLMLKMGYDLITLDQLSHLTSTANAVADILNTSLDAHHPYVGSSAFAHKGGLHASALSRLPGAYEHVDPAIVGNLAHVVVSELAGRASLLTKASELGVNLEDDERTLMEALAVIKSKENEGYSYELADGSLTLLLRTIKGDPVRHFHLESFRVIADKREDGKVMTEATIKIHVDDQRFIATGEGNGPVNALDTALRMAITEFYPEVADIELTDFRVRVLDESLGTDAVTRVLIESSDGEETWGTVGVSENVIEASWDALVDSIEFGLMKMRDHAVAHDDEASGAAGASCANAAGKPGNDAETVDGEDVPAAAGSGDGIGTDHEGGRVGEPGDGRGAGHGGDGAGDGGGLGPDMAGGGESATAVLPRVRDDVGSRAERRGGDGVYFEDAYPGQAAQADSTDIPSDTPAHAPTYAPTARFRRFLGIHHDGKGHGRGGEHIRR